MKTEERARLRKQICLEVKGINKLLDALEAAEARAAEMERQRDALISMVRHTWNIVETRNVEHVAATMVDTLGGAHRSAEALVEARELLKDAYDKYKEAAVRCRELGVEL